MLTLEDLGVLRDVETDDDGRVVVTITPTYSGCPAMATMRDDLVHALHDHGYADVRVEVSLQPRLVERLDHRARAGRALVAHGISAPGAGAQPRRARRPQPAADAPRRWPARAAARPTYG